jgi:hypothetical protein
VNHAIQGIRYVGSRCRRTVLKVSHRSCRGNRRECSSEASASHLALKFSDHFGSMEMPVSEDSSAMSICIRIGVCSDAVHLTQPSSMRSTVRSPDRIGFRKAWDRKQLGTFSARHLDVEKGASVSVAAAGVR